MRRAPSRGDAGFTLIELMAAVACMVVLGAIAAPRLERWVLDARLNEARPYLQEIAAKLRLHRVETGRYCCTAYDGSAENTLVNALGLSLGEAGSYCFLVVCRSAALCERASTTPNWIVPPGSVTPEFEVWALLRRTAGTTAVGGPGGVSCTPATGKAEPGGWVRAATQANAPGRAGQAVVLRYPPPPNGRAAATGNFRAIAFDWRDGISASDAQTP